MSAQPKSAAQAAAPTVQARQMPAPHLPLLVELAFTFARILVVLVAAVEVLLSLRAGCSIWMIALRAGVAVVTVGVGLWLIAWLTAGGTIQTVNSQMEQVAQRNADPAPSTVQMNA